MTDKYILIDHKVVKEPDTMAWAEWFEKADRIVQQTNVGKFRVSTVFLGLDYSFGDGATPLVFETMVFEGNSDNAKFCKRYCTWDEAVIGHKDCVESLKINESHFNYKVKIRLLFEEA